MRLTEETVSKRSILTIKNSDNLCLPRSLVVAHAYAVRGQTRSGKLHSYWNLIRHSNSSVQKEAAEHIMSLSATKVPTDGCGIEEIHKLQIFFAGHATAIVVYNFCSFGRGSLPLYDGTRFVIDTHGCIEYTLRLMYYERSKHYQPKVTASCSAGFCIPCNQMPPCDMTIKLKRCASCFRSFFGELCYENHLNKGSFDKNSSVCDKMKICQICFGTVRVKNSRSHECGVSYCKTCKLHLPTRHLCHIQTIETKAKESTPNSIFLLYDLET